MRIDIKEQELANKHISDAVAVLQYVLRQERQDKAQPLVVKTETPTPPAFDLDALYKLYPCKKGKSRGMATLYRQITSQQAYNALKTAIQRYSSEVADQDKKYIKHWSTFANCWRDYLETTPEDEADVFKPSNL